MLQEGSRSQPEGSGKLTGNLVARMAAVCCMHSLALHAEGSVGQAEASEQQQEASRPQTLPSTGQAAASEACPLPTNPLSCVC